MLTGAIAGAVNARGRQPEQAGRTSAREHCKVREQLSVRSGLQMMGKAARPSNPGATAGKFQDVSQVNGSFSRQSLTTLSSTSPSGLRTVISMGMSPGIEWVAQASQGS